MSFTKTSESPFTVLFTSRFFGGNLPLSAEAKLAGFLKLQTGWYNGRGEPIQNSAFRAALKILRAARGGIIETTDVFPRADGGVTVAVYYSGRDLALNIKPNGSVDIDSETDPEFPHLEGLSLAHVLFIIQGLRQWNWSSSYTFHNTTNSWPGFEAHASKGQAMVPGFPSSTRNASTVKQAPYVIMPGLSMAK